MIFFSSTPVIVMNIQILKIYMILEILISILKTSENANKDRQVVLKRKQRMLIAVSQVGK